VVPRALSADLNHIDSKFPELLLHFKEFVMGLDPPGILPKLVTKGVLEFDQRSLFADWASSICWRSVKFGSL
jgi:hypothetical protein